MGLYINIGNDGFRAARIAKVYQVHDESVPSSDKGVPSSTRWNVIFSAKQEEKAMLLLNVLKAGPISMKEIQFQMNIGNRTRFKQNIIDSLIDDGIISPMYEKPNHPNQKYGLTEKGLRLIADCFDKKI